MKANFPPGPRSIRSTSSISILARPTWEARFLNAVTGLSWTGEDVMKAGERITNIERAINVRQGLTRKDDTLSDRFLYDPIPSGPSKVQRQKLTIRKIR